MRVRTLLTSGGGGLRTARGRQRCGKLRAMASNVDSRGAEPQLSLLIRNFAPADPGGWRSLVDTAVAAEAAGVDRVVVVDHVAFGEELGDYARPELGGTSGGRQPTGPDGHWLEPLTVLTTIAAHTTRIRLATGIIQAALRRPVVLAKTVATLDVLSAGRVDLGVGVGWQRAEYAAAGLDFARRGRLLDDTLELCRRLWTEPVVDVPGAGPVHQMPKPAQTGGVPVWIGGRSTNTRVIERIVRFGSGWIPWGDDETDPEPGIVAIRAALAAHGRSDDRLQVTTALPEDPARVRRLVTAGVTDFRIHTRDVSAANLERIVTGFRDATGGLRD